MTATTFRTDTVTGILAVLNTVKAANPTLLLATYRARPPGLPDLPAAYIEGRPETVNHDSGTRTRTMQPSVFVIRRITDNVETMTAFDTLIDLMVDAFTAVPQFSTGAIWDTFAVEDVDAPFGDYDFAGVRFTFSDVTAMDGRI